MDKGNIFLFISHWLIYLASAVTSRIVIKNTDNNNNSSDPLSPDDIFCILIRLSWRQQQQQPQKYFSRSSFRRFISVFTSVIVGREPSMMSPSCWVTILVIILDVHRHTRRIDSYFVTTAKAWEKILGTTLRSVPISTLWLVVPLLQVCAFGVCASLKEKPHRWNGRQKLDGV